MELLQTTATDQDNPGGRFPGGRFPGFYRPGGKFPGHRGPGGSPPRPQT